MNAVQLAWYEERFKELEKKLDELVIARASKLTSMESLDADIEACKTSIRQTAILLRKHYASKEK